MTIPRKDEVLRAFEYVATHFPFYRDFLHAHGVLSTEIRTHTDFETRVPLIRKEDVFLGHTLDELSRDGKAPPYTSAIVSSGTSGIFSFGLLTEQDIEAQRQMLDTLLDELFNAKKIPPLIINALPMGVSFVSSYPIIPTSVRTDIIRKVITTLGKERQVIIITDPHVLKKLLEEGVEDGCVWSEYTLSAIVGGAGSSDSFITYLRSLMNDGAVCPDARNQVLQTMGVTEVALNIFGSTPDLVHLRHSIEQDNSIRARIFGNECRATPEIMYHMSKGVHLEIVNVDEWGVGDVVLTHLDTSVSTPLIRYSTGDKACVVSHEALASIVPGLPVLPLPVVAIYGREREYTHTPVTPLEVEEILYRDHEYAKMITGHFTIMGDEASPRILVHMREGVPALPEKSIHGISCVGVPYQEFPTNITLNYEYKWKHIL